MSEKYLKTSFFSVILRTYCQKNIFVRLKKKLIFFFFAKKKIFYKFFLLLKINKIKGKMTRTRPKTAAEAEELVQIAIENEDYKTAKYYNSFIDYLKNFENAVGVSTKVADYVDDQKQLENNAVYNLDEYTKAIEAAKQRSNQNYHAQFRQLRDIQRYELEEFIERWDNEREEIYGQIDDDYQNTLTTAKIVADNRNFDAAIQIKAGATELLKKSRKEELSKLNKKNKRLAEIILDRQQKELTNLVTNRDNEIELFDQLQRAAETRCLGDFLIQNASKVDETLAKFPPKIAKPLFLFMQIKTNKKPKRNEESFVPDRRAYKQFTQTMHNLNKTFRGPVDIDQKPTQTKRTTFY